MGYNIVNARDLELLAIETVGLIPLSWKLKGGIPEHTDGFAQQLVQSPGDMIKLQTTNAAEKKKFKWIA